MFVEGFFPIVFTSDNQNHDETVINPRHANAAHFLSRTQSSALTSSRTSSTSSTPTRFCNASTWCWRLRVSSTGRWRASFRFLSGLSASSSSREASSARWTSCVSSEFGGGGEIHFFIFLHSSFIQKYLFFFPARKFIVLLLFLFVWFRTRIYCLCSIMV